MPCSYTPETGQQHHEIAKQFIIIVALVTLNLYIEHCSFALRLDKTQQMAFVYHIKIWTKYILYVFSLSLRTSIWGRKCIWAIIIPWYMRPNTVCECFLTDLLLWAHWELLLLPLPLSSALLPQLSSCAEVKNFNIHHGFVCNTIMGLPLDLFLIIFVVQQNKM